MLLFDYFFIAMSSIFVMNFGFFFEMIRNNQAIANMFAVILVVILVMLIRNYKSNKTHGKRTLSEVVTDVGNVVVEHYSHLNSDQTYNVIESRRQDLFRGVPYAVQLDKFWNIYKQRYGCGSFHHDKDAPEQYCGHIPGEYICSNTINGCTFRSPLSGYVEDHLQKDCTFFCCFDLDMSNTNTTSQIHPCNVKGTLSQISEHVTTCPFVVKKLCDVCKDSISLATFDRHTEDHEQIIPCKNEKNGCTFRDTEKSLISGEHYKICNKFACPNKSCGFIGTQDEYHNHMYKYCIFCKNHISICQFSTHQDQCRNIIVECGDCYHSFANYFRVNHDCRGKIQSMLMVLSIALGQDNFDQLKASCTSDNPSDVLKYIRTQIDKLINKPEFILTKYYDSGCIYIDGKPYVRDDKYSCSNGFSEERYVRDDENNLTRSCSVA